MAGRPGRRARVLAVAAAAGLVVALASSALAGPVPGRRLVPAAPAAPPPIAFETPGTTQRVSFASGRTELVSRPADTPAISANGRWVAYATHGTTTAAAGVRVDTIQRYDRRTRQTQVVYPPPGVVELVDSPTSVVISDVAMSADGSRIAFTVVRGSTNPRVILWSAADGSYEVPGGEKNLLFSAGSPSLSADGREVAMVVGGGGRLPLVNGVYRYADGAFEPVAVRLPGTEPTFGRTAISGDGSRVAFATNLPLAGVKTSTPQVWAWNRADGSYDLVSRRPDGGPGSGASDQPSMSSNGRVVAFASVAADLAPGDDNDLVDVYVRTADGTVRRASNAPDGTAATGQSLWPSVAGDGGAVAFASDARDLVPGDTTGRPPAGAVPGGVRTAAFVERIPSDVFVVRLATGQLSRISFGRGPVEADDGSGQPSMSRTGRYVAFASNAANLVTGDGNGRTDIFVRDRPPAIAAEPNPVDFGSAALGSLGTVRTATIRSTGITPLRVGDVTRGGANRDDFLVQSNDCTGRSLAPGASCAIEVLFIGTATGDRRATLAIESDAGGPVTLRLIGSVGVPKLTVEPKVGPPGIVVIATGTGFPPNVPVSLTWSAGITATPLEPVVSDAAGSFTAQVLVLPKDRIGARRLRAIAAVPGVDVEPVLAGFRVTTPTSEPPTSGLIQVFAATPGDPIILRR